MAKDKANGEHLSIVAIVVKDKVGGRGHRWILTCMTCYEDNGRSWLT